MLVAYSNVRVTINIHGAQDAVNVDIGYFSKIASTTLINYTISSRSASAPSPSLRGEVIWYETLSGNSMPVDYLIISDPLFMTSAQGRAELERFAEYRADHNNFTIGIVNIDQVKNLTYPAGITTNAQKIRYFIKTVYDSHSAPNTYDGYLAYVLLAGDVYRRSVGGQVIEVIPASQESDPGFMLQNSGNYPNDYYYSCLTIGSNGYDKIGDLFIGRFSASSIVELRNIVSKTISFETEYDPEAEIRNFINTNMPYVSGSYFPQFQYNISSLYGAPFVTIPTLTPFPTNDCQTETSQIINNGLRTMFFYGHSTRYNLLKCDTIAYYYGLNNRYKFPICFAHECQSGWYDNHPDSPDPTLKKDCIAEFITTFSDTLGFAGILASSRNILLNHAGTNFPYFVFDHIGTAIWRNYNTIIGEIILGAKVEAFSNYLPNIYEDNILGSLFALNYFGDPALNLFPDRFYITRNLSLPAENPFIIHSPLVVTNNACLSIPANTTLIFQENGSITVEPGATLNILNNVKIFGTSEANHITIQGNLTGDQAGSTILNALFTAVDGKNGASWGGLTIESPISPEFSNCSFNHAMYQFNCNSIALEGTSTTSVADTNAQLRLTGATALTLLYHTLKNSSVFAYNSASGSAISCSIQNCTFISNTWQDYLVRVRRYPALDISNNSLTFVGRIALDVQNTINISTLIRQIVSNTITGPDNQGSGTIGISLYNCNTSITGGNKISLCDFGLAMTRNTTCTLQGNSGAVTSQAQALFDNYRNQVRVLDFSWSPVIKYNRFANQLSDDYYIYHGDPVEQYEPDIPPIDGFRNVKYNSWDIIAIASKLFPANGYDYSPAWSPAPGKSVAVADSAEGLYFQAESLASTGMLAQAELLYDSLIANWPASVFAEKAVNQYLALEESGNQNFTRVKEKYQSDSLFTRTERISRITEFMLKDVNIRMQNYDEALAWLANEIENPVSYTDSVCALIDLADVLAMQQDSTCKNRNLQSPAARLVNLPDSLLSHSFDLFHPALFIEKRNHSAEELPCETKNDLRFIVIPNPVSVSEVQLKFEKLRNTAIRIECCNLAGQTIQVMQTLVDEQGNALLKLPDVLIPGTYILRATSQTQQFNASFIKN